MNSFRFFIVVVVLAHYYLIYVCLSNWWIGRVIKLYFRDSKLCVLWKAVEGSVAINDRLNYLMIKSIIL